MKHEHGFTYLMTMFFVAMMGISLMIIGQEWSVTMKRDREAELHFRGTRIKEAIERYAADYEVQKSLRPNRYPVQLKDLTKKPTRYLPTIYKDPMTGKDFELIKTGTEIHGVRSTSKEKPYDQVNFKGAKTYHAIRYEVTGQSANCTPGVDVSKVETFVGCSEPTTTEIDPATGKPAENSNGLQNTFPAQENIQ
ncbi:type II secretion system protein [Candidatus Nitrospira salsa]